MRKVRSKAVVVTAFILSCAFGAWLGYRAPHREASHNQESRDPAAIESESKEQPSALLIPKQNPAPDTPVALSSLNELKRLRERLKEACVRAPIDKPDLVDCVKLAGLEETSGDKVLARGLRMRLCNLDQDARSCFSAAALMETAGDSDGAAAMLDRACQRGDKSACDRNDALYARREKMFDKLTNESMLLPEPKQLDYLETRCDEGNAMACDMAGVMYDETVPPKALVQSQLNRCKKGELPFCRKIYRMLANDPANPAAIDAMKTGCANQLADACMQMLGTASARVQAGKIDLDGQAARERLCLLAEPGACEIARALLERREQAEASSGDL